ncbi:glycosyltransferase [Butyrivibrio sp. MC2013]|uniref:glycosyltransferase n=1 Tax=Butyrivibrio sp. MC2013 TaxID=1280686 RepID=UPI0018CA754F|nr:glycosyltransferase [Butyrivibrio sp. MC2013]
MNNEINNDTDNDIIKSTIVISGINLFEGGPLSIYKDCLRALANLGLDEKFNIICFVHRKELFTDCKGHFHFIELPKSRKSYLFRLYYEYIYFYNYSKRRNIYIWLSLHDITPRVKAFQRYTYCHNPTPFMKDRRGALKYNLTQFLMSYLYIYLYKYSLKTADTIIVQQEWIREEFEKITKNFIVVAKPVLRGANDDGIKNSSSGEISDNNSSHTERKLLPAHKTIFISASLPRFFKNFELPLRACEILEKKGINDHLLCITVKGDENRYAKDLYKKYGHLKSVKWLGRLEREKLMALYEESDCMIFPSKLETWGLPISEYKATGKPMILADLPYAHETVGAYDKTAFCDVDAPKKLAELMESVINKEDIFRPVSEMKHCDFYYTSWEQLMYVITNEKAMKMQ